MLRCPEGRERQLGCRESEGCCDGRRGNSVASATDDREAHQERDSDHSPAVESLGESIRHPIHCLSNWLLRCPMTLRDWTDPRDGRHWRIRQTGLPTVLVFASEDDLFSVVIDFNDRLEDRSDAELQRLLDEGRGSA